MKTQEEARAANAEAARKWRAAHREESRKTSRDAQKRWRERNTELTKEIAFNSAETRRKHYCDELLVGDFSKYHDEVLSLVTSEKLISIENKGENWALGGLLYLLVKKEGISLRKAVWKLPIPDKNSHRKFHSYVKVYRVIKEKLK